ncbi:MAG: methyltransferase domain-containing protein [Nakamurella sp.]
MISPTTVFEHGLRGEPSLAVLRAGRRRELLPVGTWTGGLDHADEMLIAECNGPTLDVGCGPGRITAALARQGLTALGIDISALAVALTRRRGGTALRRDVFGPVPGRGRWNTVVLADGNIGIGGDPERLLRRCAELLAPAGHVVLDLEPPGTGLVVEEVRLSAGDAVSAPFRWCWLGADAVHRVAATAGLAPQDIWLAGRRWQARLGRAT